MKRSRNSPSSEPPKLRDLRIEIGVKPAHSDFNKRAATYAKRAKWVFEKKNKAKTPRETP